MNIPSLKHLSSALLVSSAIFLSACNSGSSSDDAPPPPPQDTGVEGPLDALQEPLSTQVLAGFSASAAGTPLETAIECLDQFLVNDVLDVLDAVLVEVMPILESDPQTAATAAVPVLQLAVADLEADLTALQSSMTGGACSIPASDGSDNPLAGTPLAPLGDALAALPPPPTDGDTEALAAYLGQLQSAIESGLSALSEEDNEHVDLPVLGGALLAVETAVADLQSTLEAAASGDPQATQTALATAVQNLLINLLAEVVPIADIEQATGQEGLLTVPIADGIAQIAALFDGSGSSDGDEGSDNAIPPEISALLEPLSDEMLMALFDEIAAAIESGEGLPPTGTPLDAILAPLSDLEALLGSGQGDGITDSPLDPLLAAIDQALAQGDACPVEGTPLDPVCTIIAELQTAIEENPDTDPLVLLRGVLDSLLGVIL